MPSRDRSSRSNFRRSATPTLLFLTGGAITGAVALAGSVAWVRAVAYGCSYNAIDVPHTPVGLVFGAEVYPDGTPSPFLAGRLDLGRTLFEAGKIDVLLVSGDHEAPEYNEPDAMRAYLIAAGVPADKVVVDYAGFDTYDSCVRAVRIFGVTQVTMITQTYHLSRTVATGRALGLDAVGVGDDTGRGGRTWWRCAVRDQLACVKTAIDLLSRRQPVLGDPEDGVDRALAQPPGAC